jgi:hypothetical protein
MRVTTELWVSALVRRIFAAGGFAAVARRGEAEAGAVFVATRNRLGETRLYGPAPQTAYDAARPDDRRFAEILTVTDEDAMQARLDRELRFDPDIWVVEIEVPDTPDVHWFEVTKP